MEAVLRKLDELIQRARELLALFETLKTTMDSVEGVSDFLSHVDQAKT